MNQKKNSLINVLILNIIFMSIKHRTYQLSILKLKLLKLNMPMADRVLIISIVTITITIIIIIMAEYFFCVPGITLSMLLSMAHLILRPYKVDSIIIRLLQGNKLSHRAAKYIPLKFKLCYPSSYLLLQSQRP